MNKRFTILMLLMALFVPWTAKAQETKTIHVVPDRGGDRGTMTVYKRVSSPTSGKNYLIVSSTTTNSDASALSQVSSTASSITASFVHISPGISATSNAAYIANLADPTAVWTATSSGSGWRFSHYNNGSTYYIYTDASYLSAGSLTASTSSTNWTWSNNQLSYTVGFLFTTTYYITPSSSGFSIGSSAANVYLFEESSVTAYDITAEVSPAGIGRVTGAGQYPAGGTCTLKASTLNNEYAFSNWTVNGTVVSTNPIYTFTVNDDQNVVANFESIASCPSPTNLTAGTPYAHSVPLAWASDADNFNVRYRTIGAGETQTFYDSFENGLGNWTVIRSGGGTDNTDWQQHSGGHHDINPHTGSYLAMSRSWANNNAYSVDNWLITPQVTLNGTLSFWAAGDANFPEFYEVYVSTTGNDINDFNWYYTPPTVTESWTQVNVDLSSFNGASGYIALRHTDTDKDFLYIDDFSIYSQSYGDWSQLIPANGTTFTLTGLESQIQYQVQVQANCGDELSSWSKPVNFTTTAPSTAAPTNLAVDVNSITAYSATVSWQGVAANDSHQYYQVYYAESNINSVPYSPSAPNLIDSITETTYTLSGLTPETEYHVWVRDYCGEDGYSPWTSYQTFTTLVSCPSPTDVTVSDVTSHGATIEWTGIGDNYQYYQVYYADSTVTFVPDSLAFPNLIDSISEAAYTLSGLISETDYHVWVRAYCGDDDGYSDWTSYQTFTTLVSCPAPTGLAVVENSISGHDATMSWDRAATQETGLVIFNYVCVAFSDTLNWDNASILIDDVDNPNQPTVNLTDLVPETEYNFYVRKDCSEEGFSREVMMSFTTEIACPTPTDLTVVESSITGHAATVSWTDASYGQQYYQVYYAESNITSVPDSLAAPNLIDSISVTSYTLSGLHSETEYHVWVRSYCGDNDGYSAWTSYQTFTTLVSCFPPTDVTITNETGHGATIEWNGTSDSYLVMVGESEQSITYSYDFEDGTSQGWTTLKGSNGTSPNNWMHISEYSYAYNYEAMSSGHGHNGSDGYMYSESYISGESQGSGTAVYPDNYLVSPQIALGGSITFHAGGQNVSYCAEQFSLMVSTTGNDAVDNFTTVQTWIFTPTASSGNEWQEFTVDLGAYSGMGYVAIRHFDCYDQWFLCIDDITIESGPIDPSWMTYEAEESPFVLYDATNIHPESTYSIQVIGICNDEESRPSVTTSFTTTIACPAPTGLAVVENSITGHGASLTWSGTSDNYNVYLGIDTAPTLPNVDFSNGIPSNWNNDASYPWSIVDGHIQSGNAGVSSSTSTISVSLTFPSNGTIEFDAECSGEGTSTFWDHCDFIIDETTQFSNGANTSGWNHYSYEVAAGQHTFTWSYTKDGSIDPTGDYFAIDNIMMMLPPNIVWNDPISVESTEYTLSGLISETTYYVKVQSDCGDDGVSTESNTVTFTTLVSCPAPIPLDPTDVTSSSAVLNWDGDAESYNVSYYKTFFFESFEEDLSQWTIYKNGDEASFEWGIENPHDNSSDLNAHSGFFAAVAYSDIGIHADSWLVTPQILLPSQTKLKFWIMRSTYDDAQDEYEVRLSTSGNAIEDFDDIILKPKTVANSYWTEEVIDLSEYDGQQVYIAIRHDYTSGFFIMVDDFGIFGWSEPIATTDNSLAIEDLLPETEYQWQVQANCGEEDGLSHWSEISTLTTLRACPIPFYLEAYDETAYGATIDWTGFSDSYVVMVRENEDEEAPSSYSYDFEDGTLQGWTILKGTTGDSPNNWMLASEYPTSVNDISSGHGHNSSDGFMLSESYIYGETQGIGTAVTPDNYLVSPQVWLGGSITFYAGTPDASFRNEKFSVMVSTTGNDAVSNFTAVQTWTSITTETSGTAWKQYTVDLSAFSGKGYIAIRHFDCRDQWLLCIDDITIENGPVIPTWFTYEAGTSPFVLYDPENLSAETTYLVKVKGFCGDEATDFSDNITFTTLDENTKIFVTEGDWSDDYNWVPFGIPSIEQNVILRAEATVFDVAEANAITVDNAGMLTIEDGGQLKTNNDVEATMKKFIIGYGTDYVETNDGYYLMALPIVDPISAVDAGLITEESEYDLYSWDRTATDEEWHNNHDSLDIENGMGFLYANQDDREMSFTALLRNSSESIVATPAYDEVDHGGWNLYGNPFPCEVYITTEAEGMTFYRLIGNELVPIDWAIAPMEAFFVKATAAGQTFTISREAPEESKSPTNGNTNRFKVSTVTK